jgi:hypothetical protein
VSDGIYAGIGEAAHETHKDTGHGRRYPVKHPNLIKPNEKKKKKKKKKKNVRY